MKVYFNNCDRTSWHGGDEQNINRTGWGKEEGGEVRTNEGGICLEEEGEHSSTSEQGKESVDCDRKSR